MSTTLTRPSKTKTVMPKQIKLRHLPHTPNYITIMPPGNVIEEKIAEMGIDAAELARRMKVPAETIEKLLRYQISLTPDIAKKLEKVTQIPADLMMRFEIDCRQEWAKAVEHPEIPALLNGEIINQPNYKTKKKGGQKNDERRNDSDKS